MNKHTSDFMLTFLFIWAGLIAVLIAAILIYDATRSAPAGFVFYGNELLDVRDRNHFLGAEWWKNGGSECGTDSDCAEMMKSRGQSVSQDYVRELNK